MPFKAQTPTTVLQGAIRKCRDVEGEAAYKCLVSIIGEGGNMGGGERTMKEVLIRSLAVHVISLGSYGHLMSLQGVIPASRLRGSWMPAIMLAAFFIVPELALAQLFGRFWCECVRILLRKQRGSLWYHAGAFLGSYTSNSSAHQSSVPLQTINTENLCYERKKYDLIWAGRLLLLCLVLGQYLGGLVLCYRSFTTYAGYWNSFVFFDQRNLHMIVGGLVAVVNSILLTFTNLAWPHESAGDEHLSLRTITHQNPENEPPPPDSSLKADLRNCSHSGFILRKLQSCNKVFVKHLDHFLPLRQQQEIEVAIVMHSLVYSIRWLARLPQLKFFELAMFIRAKNANTTVDLSQAQSGYPFGPLWRGSPAGPFLRFKGFFDIHVLLYLSSMVVLTSFWIRCFARNAWLGRYMPRRMRALFAFCNEWITGGRSVVSFPFFFMLAICFVVWVDFQQLLMNADWHSEWSQMREEGSHWDRLYVSAYRYKDPWYDSMYIL